MILNGAVIRFKTRTRLELNSHARFLFGKQIMPAEEATSPLRQAYFALQQAYISDEEERPEALQRARDIIRRFMGEAPEAQREDWSALLRLTSEETVLDALKRARQMIRAAESAPQGN